MATLQEFRQQYPQYNDMGDQQLADSMHAKFYADMPREQFDAKIGYAPPRQNVQFSPPEAAQPAPSVGRRLTIGAQGVGTGVADTVGAPVDIMTGLLNAGIRGINWMASQNVPTIKEPVLGSDFIRNWATKGVEAAGVPLVEPENMNSSEKLGYDINRFGTQALSMAGPAALAAGGRQAAIAAGNTAPKIGDAFMRPYFDAPARTVAGDAAAGAGAGAATNAVDKVLPEKQPDSPWMNTGVDVARGLAPIAGGVGGSTLASAGEGSFRVLKDAFVKGRVDPNIPLDAANPSVAPVTRGVAEKASRMMQDVASNPQVAARNIRESADASAAAGMPQPTAGLVSGDVGLQSAEAAARTKNGVPFIENDNKLRTAATERVNSLRDPGADQMQPRNVAQIEAAFRTNKADAAAQAGVRDAEVAGAANVDLARSGVQSAEQAARQAEADSQRFGAPIAAQANSDAKAQASRRLDASVVDQGYIPARTEKNRQFDTAPGRTQQLPADRVFDAVDEVRAANNRLRPDEQLPGDFVARINTLRPRIDKETGENIGGPGVVRGGDLADTRKYLSTAYEKAQKAGNFDLADSIAKLRGAINETIEGASGYAEANANYGRFADRYRPSPNDEAAKFTRQIDRDPGRGLTPPTETASRFLSAPEKAQTLQRMMDGTDGPAAVRDYLRSDFGSASLNANGTINPQRAAAWARKNADVLSQFPQVRGEFDDMVATARRGEQLSETARGNLTTAQRNAAATEQQAGQGVRDAERVGQQKVKATEQEIDRSAIGTLLKEDPRDVAARLFGSKKYDAQRELGDIQKLIGGDKPAQRGWKAAVSEHLSDSMSGTAKLDAGKAGASDTYRVELSKLDKTFKDNRSLLAQVYLPDEMNRLQQAHAALEPLKNASVRATSGSNTADKGEQMARVLEAGLKAKYGVLKGGGIMRTMKIMMSTLPDDGNQIQAVVNRAWFNPDIAEYLLTNKVRNLDAATQNKHIKTLMGGAAYGRSSGEDPSSE